MEEALKLEGDKEVSLYKLVLRNGTIFRFRNGVDVTWQDDLYENMPCQLQGEESVAGDQDNRPTFVVINHLAAEPDGEEEGNIFGPLAASGILDLATLYRYKVLPAHLASDANIFQRKLWLVVPKTVTSRSIHFELRSPLDVPNIRVPRRIYAPPEFPVVTI
jgi:phage-related protein